MAEVNKISSFRSFSEIKAQENEMKLREENNLKKQETLSKISEILDEMGLTNLSEIDEDSQQTFISKLLGREMNEGNAFVFAASKAKSEGKDEFEFNGKKYKVTIKDTGLKEGNAFVFAASKAKAEGKDEFEFNGKKYKVTIKDTGLKEGNAFGDAVRKAKEEGATEFEFDGKTYKVEEANVNEGSHGMATKLLQSLVKGETSKAEGIKMSKELAQHYIDWIRTSPYGKKNGNLPLNMLIDASFNWGIERGLDPSLKSELKDLKGISVKESFLLTEGTRGQFGKIDKQGKIQSVYTHYDSYPENMLPIIKKHYKNAKAVNNVIAKGDMSGLDAFDNINFYGATSKPSIGSADKINDFVKFTKENGGAEFVYLFDERDKKWYMIDIYGGSKLVPAFESFVVEGAVKQFDVDFNNMVKNIKSGYGWIDPEYVADTWENSSDSIDFELVKGEIYKRLIAAKLLAYADDEDEESAGQYVKSLKELGIKESLVNEAFFRLPKDVIGNELYLATQNLSNLYGRTLAGNDIDTGVIDTIIKALTTVKKSVKKFNNKEEVLGTVYEAENFKSTKDFLDFLEEIDGMPENRIKRIMGKDYIDTPGGFRDEADDYDNDIEEYTRSNMGNKDFEKLKTWWETNVAESVNESADFGDLLKYEDNPYGIGASSVELEKGSHGNSDRLVFRCEDKGRRDEIEKKLKSMGFASKKMTKSTADKAYTYRYELTLFESVVNEAEVKSDDEFKEYAMTVLKKAFGDEFDEAKAGEVVDGILKKCGDDYGAAVGMLTSSLGESVVTEREETQIGTHRYQGKSYPLYTDDEHNHYIKVNGRIIAVDESV